MTYNVRELQLVKRKSHHIFVSTIWFPESSKQLIISITAMYSIFSYSEGYPRSENERIKSNLFIG